MAQLVNVIPAISTVKQGISWPQSIIIHCICIIVWKNALQLKVDCLIFFRNSR